MADSTGSTAGSVGDVLLVEARGPIRILTLNRPHALNAANRELHAALATVWSEVAREEDVRAVVLTGAGNAFSGGGDLELLEQMTGDTALRKVVMDEASVIVRSLLGVTVPVVAAVNGPAVGLGCSLASLCDIVIVDEDAYFADPHVGLGLVAADGGALSWPTLTSLLRAKELLLLGDRVPAAEAVTLGLANRVVPHGTALDEAIAVAERIAALPPQSVAESKRLLNHSLRTAVESALDDALAAETRSFDEPAFRNNLRRLLDKMRRRT